MNFGSLRSTTGNYVLRSSFLCVDIDIIAMRLLISFAANPRLDHFTAFTGFRDAFGLLCATILSCKLEKAKLQRGRIVLKCLMMMHCEDILGSHVKLVVVFRVKVALALARPRRTSQHREVNSGRRKFRA